MGSMGITVLNTTMGTYNSREGLMLLLIIT